MNDQTPEMGKEYRVAWLREGMRRPKWRRYQRRSAAERFIRILTSPEPWVEWGETRDGDEYLCCSGTIDGGYPCGCKGITVKEDAMLRRDGLPTLHFVRLEVRAVSRWQEVA